MTHFRSNLKPWLLATIALLVAGCGTPSESDSVLTAEQAQVMAVELANSNAVAVYHFEPFTNRSAVRFEQGRWIWTARVGYGFGDIEARVELADDGSTNSVHLRVLDNRQFAGDLF